MSEIIGLCKLKTSNKQGTFYAEAIYDRSTVESENEFDDEDIEVDDGLSSKGFCPQMKTVNVDVSCISVIEGVFEDIFKLANNDNSPIEITVVLEYELEEEKQHC